MSKVFSKLSANERQRVINSLFNQEKNTKLYNTFFINKELDEYIFDKNLDLETRQKNFCSVLKEINDKNYAVHEIFSRKIRDLLKSFISFNELKSLLSNLNNTDTATIFDLIQSNLPTIHRSTHFLRLMDELISVKIKQPLESEKEISCLLRFIEKDPQAIKYGLEFKTVIEFVRKSANPNKILEILRPSLFVRFKAWLRLNNAEELVSTQLSGAQIVETILFQPDLTAELLRKPSVLSQIMPWGEESYIEKLDSKDWKKLLLESVGDNHEIVKNALSVSKFSTEQKNVILSTFNQSSHVIEQKIKSNKVDFIFKGKKRIEENNDERSSEILIPHDGPGLSTIHGQDQNVSSVEKIESKITNPFYGSPYFNPELTKTSNASILETDKTLSQVVVRQPSFKKTSKQEDQLVFDGLNEKKNSGSPSLVFDGLNENKKNVPISPLLDFGDLNKKEKVAPEVQELNFGDLKVKQDSWKEEKLNDTKKRSIIPKKIPSNDRKTEFLAKVPKVPEEKKGDTKKNTFDQRRGAGRFGGGDGDK